MTDIALHPQTLDAAIFGGQLVLDSSLRTAVLISLFTDREVPELHEGQRGGWWGDALAAVDGDRIGSRLWTLQREKLTPLTAQRVKSSIEESLAWLIEDGAARRVAVATELQPPSRIAARIELYRPDGQRDLVRFAIPWRESLGASAFERNAATAARFTDLAALYEFEYFVHYPEIDG